MKPLDLEIALARRDAQGREVGFELAGRVFEAIEIRLEPGFAFGELLLRRFDPVLCAVDVGAFARRAARTLYGARSAADVADASELATEDRPEERRAERNHGLRLAIGVLLFLAVDALLGDCDPLLQAREFRRVLLAQLLDVEIALRAHEVRQSTAERALVLARKGNELRLLRREEFPVRVVIRQRASM